MDDTPETTHALHGVWYRGDHGSAIPELCRRLERERDEWKLCALTLRLDHTQNLLTKMKLGHKTDSGSDDSTCSAFRGPIERHQGTIRVRVDVQREGSDYWARVVADPTRPDSMPLASGQTREMAIHAACEQASIPPNANVDLPDTAAQDSASKSNNPAVSG